ncbi:hypothetical protein REPUB_Repub03eG0161500 [Reevesia pubescens]
MIPEHITWKAPWMPVSAFVYKCGENPWVPLIGLRGAVSYTPLLVCRQFGSTQFISMTHGLDSLEFDYKINGYMVKVRQIAEAWKRIGEHEAGKLSDKATLEYLRWKGMRVKDAPAQLRGKIQSSNFSPGVFLSEAEIVRQEWAGKEKKWEKE